MSQLARRVYEDMPATMGWPSPPEDEGVFDATLAPNRSLRNVGFLVLMATLIVMSFSAGLVFFMMGAWPVIGFFGLDILLVWLAFKISYRQGRLMERVHVSPARVTVVRRHPAGHVQHWLMPTYWARVLVDDPVVHESQVRLVNQGKTLILGAFLSPPERAEFAEALRRALDAARDVRWEVEGDVADGSALPS